MVIPPRFSDKILKHINSHGWSTDNIAFGSGGGLLQKLNRDTQKCAFKCSLAIIDGKEVPVYKDPATDPGKKSKKGYLSVHRSSADGSWETRSDGNHDFESDEMRVVFENGYILVDEKWEDIKKRSELTEDMLK